MKKLMILIHTIIFCCTTSNFLEAQPVEKFKVEVLPFTGSGQEYHSAISDIINECFQHSNTFEIAIDGKTDKADFYVLINVNTAKMESIKCTSFDYYKRENTYIDGYNFILSIEIKLIDSQSGIALEVKEFGYSYQGYFEAGVLASSIVKAMSRTMLITQGEIFSWIYANLPTIEKVYARMEDISKQTDGKHELALRE